MSDKNILVELHKAGFKQNNKWLVEGVSLKVEKGKIVTLIGPNGSGKSTLSYVLSGRDGYEVTDGSAHLLGEDILDMEPEERAAAGLFLSLIHI